jgi:hypothetical protein
VLHGNAIATSGAADPTSGVSSSSCSSPGTSAVGPHTVTCTATDAAGNTRSASAPYSVVYRFVGFSSPLDNAPTLNVAKSGRAIPLKWRLLDANNVPVTDLTSVTLRAVTHSCSAGTTPDQVEEYAAGASGLQNQGNGYYQVNWKVPTTYAQSCKTLELDLGEGDGQDRTALFQFTK